ncbi:putative serine/threonine-protein kinase gdt4 [Gossypium arboreum]|uniref:Putative serine/threonine-protein kinase gdt4 n=1 Tax=Gossypium arboreum TaxID=29729 RepID=A0A0B0NEL4_GOSAR|nr:putative serine/threonine-protein kinase gdt4 [Gossypium arboreum]
MDKCEGLSYLYSSHDLRPISTPRSHLSLDLDEGEGPRWRFRKGTGRRGSTRVVYGGVQRWYGDGGLSCGAERMGLGLGFPIIFNSLGLSGSIFGLG